MKKTQLRAQMRDILTLPPDLRGEKSRVISERIVAHPAWKNARTVALFAPQAREPDVELLWSYAGGRRFAYPRIAGEVVELYAVDSLFDLQPAQWGIREPSASSVTRVRPDEIDLILVPGVAFTRSGQRCGRGGGFYDRLLATLPAAATKLGVCFAEQIVDELPTEPHDMMVDEVISA
jgi:5-formyltetrahydrofolate cyclo-ligase